MAIKSTPSLHKFMFNHDHSVRRAFEQAIVEDVSTTQRGNLSDAALYAVESGGKRLRPFCTYALSSSLGIDAIDLMLSIEYFHTASLILDDLPCMDNDDMRRGRASLHIKYDEQTAILTAFALNQRAYERIASCKPLQKAHKGIADAIKLASVTSGMEGAAFGQYADLNPVSGQSIMDVIDLKTSSLFEVAFGYGILAAGKREKLPLAKKMGRHFGRAFQILDDIIDFPQDSIDSASSNVACIYGLEKAQEMLEKEKMHFFNASQEIEKDNEALLALHQVLHYSSC